MLKPYQPTLWIRTDPILPISVIFEKFLPLRTNPSKKRMKRIPKKDPSLVVQLDDFWSVSSNFPSFRYWSSRMNKFSFVKPLDQAYVEIPVLMRYIFIGWPTSPKVTQTAAWGYKGIILPPFQHIFWPRRWNEWTTLIGWIIF